MNYKFGQECGEQLMIINIFKDIKFWRNLEQYNNDIIEIWNKYEDKRPIAKWFDPKLLKGDTLWVRKSNKSGHFFIKDFENPEYWNLIVHPNNYLPIFLLNTLYRNRKSILIEDVCSGMGRMAFYLSKLGFNNFSFIDNFSGISQELFEKLMEKGNIKYILNQKETKPIVSNLASYPWYTSPLTLGMSGVGGWNEKTDIPPKEEVPIQSCELFCFYCAKVIFETIGKYLLNNGYVELCQDSEYIQVAYCKKELEKKFKKELRRYEKH